MRRAHAGEILGVLDQERHARQWAEALASADALVKPARFRDRLPLVAQGDDGVQVPVEAPDPLVTPAHHLDRRYPAALD